MRLLWCFLSLFFGITSTIMLPLDVSAQMDSISESNHLIAEINSTEYQMEQINDQINRLKETIQVYKKEDHFDKFNLPSISTDISTVEMRTREHPSDEKLLVFKNRIKHYQQAHLDKKELLKDLNHQLDQSKNKMEEKDLRGNEEIDFIFPVLNYHLTSPYGMRYHPIYGDQRMHEGIDLVGDSDIRACSRGQITRMAYHSGYGYFLELDHGQGVTSLYAHLAQLPQNIGLGEVVDQGQIIATMGTTGASTGVHLHFEMRVDGLTVNPLDYLQ